MSTTLFRKKARPRVRAFGHVQKQPSLDLHDSISKTLSLKKACRSKAGNCSRFLNGSYIKKALLSLGASALSVGGAQAATAHWNGAVDSNWNIPGNWSTGQVPGTSATDLVILSSNDELVVVAPFLVNNEYSIYMRQKALLQISAAMPDISSIRLGSHSGLDGADITQPTDNYTIPSVNILDDLRVGHNANVMTDSSYKIAGGSLTIGDELYVNKGAFQVEGPESSISTGRMTLKSNAELIFDFDLKGASPIVVAGAFTIDSGASLIIDIRNYRDGGNVVELVKYGSRNGSFNANDITIMGGTGATISYDSDSMNLTFADPIQDRSTSLWFINTGGDGTDPTDLRLNTGHLIRDISSSDLTYTQTTSGNALIYTCEWTGSDIDGDGFNDVVSFDLRVEGFTGSTYTYNDIDTGPSSMTALGTPAVVGVDSASGAWGVGSDADLDAGESLRFRLQNLSSGVDRDGIISFQTAEPNGGYNHKLIWGQGTGLDSVATDSTEKVAAIGNTLVVTSAADSKVALGNIVIKLKASGNSLNTMILDHVSNYSSIADGPYYREEYAEQTDLSNYPEFSWDVVPRWAGVSKGTPLTAAEAQQLTDNHQILGLGGFAKFGTPSNEAGAVVGGMALKAANPDVTTLFYWNAHIDFGSAWFAANALYDPEWHSYSLDANGNRDYFMIRQIYNAHNFAYPEFRQWWVDTAVNVLSSDYVDGIFVDKASSEGSRYFNGAGDVAIQSDRFSMYHELFEQVPDGKLIVGNSLRGSRTSGNRELLHFMQGAYLESLDQPNTEGYAAQSEADTMVVSIQLMREAALKKKFLMPRLSDGLTPDEAKNLTKAEALVKMRAGVKLPLAYFLIIAEEYSYFRYQPDQDISDKDYLWDPTSYISELYRPLGAPEGPPVKNGYVYTRAYEHVDVYLNVKTQHATLTWH